MAENKKSFVLYSDLIKVVDKLPDESAGKLFKIILKYVNDQEVCIEDLLLEIAFEPIKNQLKRDLVKYEGTKEAKSINAKIGNLKRYDPDIYSQYSEGKINLEAALNLAKSRKSSQKVANLAVNDNVNVTDNVNDNVNVNVSTIVDGEKATDANFETNPDSDQIKNPEAEKEKSFAKKENANDVHAEILKSEESQAWLEAVAMQNRKTTEDVKNRIDDFVKFLTTVDRIHPTKREFLEHFINWLKKNVDRPEPQFQNKGSSGVPKFSINQ